MQLKKKKIKCQLGFNRCTLFVHHTEEMKGKWKEMEEQQGLLGEGQYQNCTTQTQTSSVSCREKTVFRGRLNVR